MKLFEAIATAATARANCEKSGNTKWFDRWDDRLTYIKRNLLPSGSGFDQGTSIDSATDEKIVFLTAFHHMDENGYYDGWTEHSVIVRPSLLGGFRLSVGGRNRNAIKDYIGDTFHTALCRDFDWTDIKEGGDSN